MKRYSFTLATSVAAAAFLAGCLATNTSTTIARPAATRAAVEFETSRAASTFNHEVQARYQRGDGELSSTRWGIPFIYASRERTVLSQNAFYNVELERADTDADGVITELEVASYVEPAR